MNFYDKVIQFFDESKIALASKFLPPYISSIACHILNIENQKREFYFEHGQVSNMRLHVFFCAPPGFMKTLLLTKMLDGDYSVLGKSETVLTGFEGSMSEAGFVGSIKFFNNEVIPTFGAAHEHREAILGIDEFAALTNIMKMEHSLNLDNALLTALDKGYVRKRLAAGKIAYSTQLTLHTGSQPARIDLSSGLARRFWFEFFIPTRKEEDMIKKARRNSKNVPVPHSTLKDCRRLVDDISYGVSEIEKIRYDPGFYAMLDRIKVPHYEEVLYERFALGYYITKYGIDKKIDIAYDASLAKLIDQGNQFRKDLKDGAELSQIMNVLRDWQDRKGNKMSPTKTELTRKMTDHGMEPSISAKLLVILQKQGRIEIAQEKAGGIGRPRIRVLLKED